MSSGKVFVSGASGFVAAHVLKELLEKGYSVRASVRSQIKADQIAKKYPQFQDKLEFVLVEDISKEGAFDGKLNGVVAIFHTASPYHFKPTTSNRVDLLDPAIKGTVGILESALKESSVKRVIITSSFAAMVDPKKDASHVYSEADWNPITIEEGETGNGMVAYRASKTFAEKAAFEFVKSKKPHFDIVTLLPPFIYGPIEHHIEKLSDLNESARSFYDHINGVKEIDFPAVDLMVDVRDIATAHIKAYESGLPNERYFIVADNFGWQEVANVAHKEFSGQTKAKLGNPNQPYTPKIKFDNSKSKTQIGMTYRPKEETFKDIITQLILLEKQGK